MYAARDQYGQMYWNLEKPRRDLLKRLGRKYAEKMYVDKRDGRVVHTGYVIAGLWLHVFKVIPIGEVQP